MKATPLVAALLCLPMTCGHALASEADNAQTSSETAVEHILVYDKAEQRRSITEIDLARFSGFSKTIDRSEFDHRFTRFGDLLDDLPGIQVRQSGGIGTFTNVSIRGSTGKQVNLFVDGLLLNNPSSGSASVSHIPSLLIERVEAYPDFTPAQLGNANLAGAINFKSRDLSNTKPGAKLNLVKGSFGLESAELSAWGKLADWDVIGGGSTIRADNDFPVDSDLYRTTSKRRLNDGYQQDDMFLKLGRDWQTGRFSTLLQASDAEKELPTTLNQQRDNASVDQKNLRLQAVLDYQLGALDFGHRAFISKEEERYRDPDSTIGLGTDDIESNFDGLGLFNTARYVKGEHEWVLSLELREDDVQRYDHVLQRQDLEAQRNTAIVALADTWQPGERHLINATLRQYLVEDEVLRSFDATADDTIEETSANVGAQWRPTPHLTMKGNAGLLVRVPTLAEKFGARGTFVGNPELQAETGSSLDGGISVDWAWIKLDASLFYRQVDDGIVTVFNSRGVGRADNIAKSETLGLESELRVELNDWLRADVNATLLDTENQTQVRDARGKKLPGIYHSSYGLGLTAHFKTAQFKLSYQRHDELYYEPANAVEADTKKELDASATFFWKTFTLDLSARNLLDENFLDLNRFPTPGRSLVITLGIEI